ncbi:MAG: hypothetical protein GY849_03305 [Deltaproteobacteria bacterium]|nr:hypothetical protein [Deltaproteobacteria bacterium]
MAFQLDLSEYQPYKTMGRSCRLKDIAEFHVHWPELVTSGNLTNSELMMRYLRGDDIDRVVELWKNVYPEVYGSTHQFVFDPRWYEDHVLLEENRKKEADKNKHAIILMEDLEENQLVGILLMTKWDQNLQVEFTMGGLHPAFRKKEIFYLFFKDILDSFSETEAELITVFAETWHKKTQELMDYYGFKIWGVFPGNMIRWSRNQKCYRACEVHYYKFINNGEKFATGPDEWVLSEKSKKLWQALEILNE